MGRRKQKQKHFENVELVAAGGEGHALAKIDGKVIFVKYGAPGDLVDLEIVGRKKKFSLAKISKLHRASELRVDSFCEHYGTCGGCKWQHIEYSSQLKLKEQWADDCLERIGKVGVNEKLPILGADTQLFYRNKMEYTFSNKRWLYENETLADLDHTNALGFHAPGRFDKVLAINKCWLQDDLGNDIRNFVYDFCIKHNFTFYDLREHTGLMRNLMLRNTRKGDWMVNVIFAKDEPENRNLLLNAIREKFNPYALNYCINEKLNDSTFDQTFISYKGNFEIQEELNGLKFNISPKSFFQTNPIQAEKLYQVALDFAGITENDVVYDLYCGTGTITCLAAAKAKKAIGVEIIDEAIEAAKANAAINNINNVEFLVGDMKDVFNPEFYAKHGSPDIIITDPPRSGMHPKVVEYLSEIKSPKLVYVSCNPATQARDLAILDSTYQVVKSQAVDMFPQTHHVENVVLLELRSTT
ncbi:MAG: 23S rRNA (uracil(1939)-C(5))-methyltransferase RlmD [Bacteroidia bacterium]|nr:23S rRNA (uracil(1939)-C(5))-methyltransferase RlmD [Bacteroidia bacterium]